MHFEIGDRVANTRGQIGIIVDIDTTGWDYPLRVQWQGPTGAPSAAFDGRYYEDLSECEVMPERWLRPGIGAVVAMVAAVKMFRGDWAEPEVSGEIHWDWAPSHLSSDFIPGCGAACDLDSYVVQPDAQDVTCDLCLDMLRRVYGTEKCHG